MCFAIYVAMRILLIPLAALSKLALALGFILRVYFSPIQKFRYPPCSLCATYLLLRSVHCSFKSVYIFSLYA